MSCRITKDSNGKIIKVLGQNGQESKVFNKITELPHVESLEQAVTIYDEIIKANPLGETDGFVSNASVALTNLKDKNPKNIKGWKSQLTDVQKNGGIRNVGQELSWIGFSENLNDWVSENNPKNGNIPINVVENYINANKIEISDVVKQNSGSGYGVAETERVRIQDTYGIEIEIDENAFGDPMINSVYYNNKFIGDDTIDPEEVPEDFPIAEIEDQLKDMMDLYHGVDADSGAKYETYTLKGGENYREVLLTMPQLNSGILPLHKQYEEVMKERDRLPFNSEERKVKSDQLEEINDQMSKFKDYRSGHWEEANILSHMRFKSRTLPNGETVLFVEEIQSDWAQQGKKYGYKEYIPKVTISKVEEGDLSYKATFSDGSLNQVGKGVFPNHTATEEQVRDYFKNILKDKNEKLQRENDQKVPDMPYQKTDQWVGLTIRKVYQMAAQEGFDRVAWVTGEQSADRYNLSKYIESVKHYRNGDGTYGIVAIDKHTEEVSFERSSLTEKELAEYVGKDVADKIVKREGEFVGRGVNLREMGRAIEVVEGEWLSSTRYYIKHENLEEPRGVWANKEDAEKEVKRFNKDYIDNPVENEPKVLSNLDLKVGGQGMKTFYDSILPKMAKKEAQRYDKNAKVEVVNFGDEVIIKDGKVIKGGQEVATIETREGGLIMEDIVTGERGYIASEEKAIENFTDELGKQLSVPITNKMKNIFGTSAIPMFSLESTNEKYNSFKEALDNADGKTVDIVSNGKVIASLPTNLDERTTQGVINSYIFDGILKPNKVVFNGKTYFQTTGETPQDRLTSEEFFKETIRTRLDKDQYNVSNGLIEIKDLSIQESVPNSVHRTIADKLLDYFSGDTVVSKSNQVDETNLKLNLMQILSDMGVSVISLKEYQKKFKRKSQNIPPNAEALADIANRVIAFKDGQLTLNNLTEEVMHLIVETLPKEQLESLSEFIKESQEYQDYYEQYKEVYNNDNTLIEKEILGKILKNIALNKVEGKSESFLSRLFAILRDFFNNLTVSQDQRDQLKQLNGLVDRLVMQQNGSNFNEGSLAASQEIALMYSLSDQVSNAQGAFEKTFKNITDYKQFNSYKRELKNISFDNLKGRELAVAVSRFIEMSTKLIETTESAIETAKSRNKALSGQNKAILEDLDSEIASNLDSLAVELSTPQPGIKSNERVKLAEKLRENSARISELRALNDQTTDEHINQMVEEIVQQLGQAESDFFREQVDKVLRGEIDDTNKIFSFFGQLHHASNPILNMIGSKIWEMNMKANQGIKEDVSEFLNYMDENNISKEEFDTLVKDGYFQDVVDHKAFQEALETAEMNAFSEASGQDFVDLSEYRKLKQAGELNELNEEEYGNYTTLLRKNQMPLVETVMNEQYYQDLFAKYDRLNISGATQSFLKQNSAQRGAVKANATETYIDADGNKKSRVVLSPEDNNNLNSISKIRKARKNIYSETSTLKKGLKLSNEQPAEENVLLPTGQYLSLNITDDMSQGEKDFANISFDLHKLDADYAAQVQAEGGNPNATTSIAKFNFIEYINSIKDDHTDQELYNIIMSNLDVSLSQQFYDSLNGDSFLKGDQLEQLNPDNLGLVADVKELYAKRNAILSMYRNTSSPFEIDRMTESDQDIIRSLSIRISDALRTLTLPTEAAIDEDNVTVGEKSANKAYLAELDRRGIAENTQEELDFLMNSQHTNVSRMNKLKDAYYKNEAGIPVSESDARMLDKYLGLTLLETQLRYAKANMQPYYTRFAPVGYKSIEEKLAEGGNIVEIVGDIFVDPYLEVRVDNSFEEKDNPLKNPNYDETYDGGFLQPKKGSFKNQDFINRFGIDSDGNATKNLKLFEARRLYLETRKKGLEKMGEKGANPYRAIQISKTTTEKLRTLAKGKNKQGTAKELLKDTFAYRIDDLAYGESGFQSNRLLPKYYTRDLEDQTDVSTDYMFALTQFVSRANEYQAKRNVISDIDALYDVLLRSKRHSKIKDLNNTIAIADNYIDNSIYGKIENRTYEIKVPGTDYSMDLAKVSRVFTKYVSLKNLGFNIHVPATGWISGLVSKRVEEWIGEKLNRDSARLANAEFKRLRRDAKKNALDFNDNSTIFLIGQAFGLYDMSDKTRNAKYNKFQRTFSKSAMGLHTVANFPIIPRIALTVMYDNRIIGNEIKTRKQFFQEQAREGIPVEQTEAAWKNAEDDAIYNYMNFTKEGFKWDDRIKDKISDENYLENRKLFMMKYIRQQVSNVDATIPHEMRLAAQRDAVGSMMLLHKGFLSIFLQNRLKRRNLNIDTGLLEEGSYRTMYRLMADFFNLDENGDRNMKQKVQKLIGSIQPPNRSDFDSQKAYESAMLDYELDKRNMRRIGKELAAMGILVSLGSLIFAAASDPDNEDLYLLQMTSYLTTRLLNESGTAFTPSIATDLADVVESPIVTYGTAKELTQFYRLFDGDEITRGKYKGLSVRQKWITKNVFGFKGLYDIWGADNIRDTERTYRLYNEENINRATLGLNSLFKSIYKD